MLLEDVPVRVARMFFVGDDRFYRTIHGPNISQMSKITALLVIQCFFTLNMRYYPKCSTILYTIKRIKHIAAVETLEA